MLENIHANLRNNLLSLFSEAFYALLMNFKLEVFMILKPQRLLIRFSLISIAVILAGCAGGYGGGLYNRAYGYGNGYYGNQGAHYNRQPYYGYPTQGNGYYQSSLYNNYSYPPYYSHHHHDGERGYERHYEREHDRD
ncbi:MAG TPA: hypothetical protein VIF37_09280 [Methylobacter sp.]